MSHWDGRWWRPYWLPRYKGLALGGVARVGQVQLLQPFLTLLGAALLLGESLQLANILFALVIIAVVGLGRRMAVRR